MANCKMEIVMEGTDFQSIEFRHDRFKETFDFSSIRGLDDEVTIEFFSDDNGSSTIFLSQDQLKALVSHLQKQVK